MTYKCEWGCTSYNPTCDACEGYVRDDSPFNENASEVTNIAVNGIDEKDDDGFSLT